MTTGTGPPAGRADGAPAAAAPHEPNRGHRDDGPTGQVRRTVSGAAATEQLGRDLAALLRPGDLVLLSGELGAGKTTLTRGIGAGLGVRGPVTSPTFVIARTHPSLVGGPALVHVDAYRLAGGLDEMEDLDLDVVLPESVVVVEWGEGRVEELAEDRLLVRLERTRGDASGRPTEDPDQETRTALLTGVGARWDGPAGRRLAALAD